MWRAEAWRWPLYIGRKRPIAIDGWKSELYPFLIFVYFVLSFCNSLRLIPLCLSASFALYLCTFLRSIALKYPSIPFFFIWWNSTILFACAQTNLLFAHSLSHFSLLLSHNPLNTYTSNLPVLFCNCTLLLAQVVMNKLKGKGWKNRMIMRVGVDDGVNSWLHSRVWLFLMWDMFMIDVPPLSFSDIWYSFFEILCNLPWRGKRLYTCMDVNVSSQQVS